MPSFFQVHTGSTSCHPCSFRGARWGNVSPSDECRGSAGLAEALPRFMIQTADNRCLPIYFHATWLKKPRRYKHASSNDPMVSKNRYCGENKQISRKAVQEAMSSARPPSCIKDKQLNSKMLLSTAFNKKIYSALCDFRRQQMESRLEQDVIWQICSHKGIITFRLGKWVLRQWNVKPGQPTLLEAYSFSLTFILVSTQGEVGRHSLAVWKSIRVFKHLLWISKQKYKVKTKTMAHNPAARVNARKQIHTKQKVYKKNCSSLSFQTVCPRCHQC